MQNSIGCNLKVLKWCRKKLKSFLLKKMKSVECAVLSRLLANSKAQEAVFFDSDLKIESRKQKDFDKRDWGCIMASSFGD